MINYNKFAKYQKRFIVTKKQFKKKINVKIKSRHPSC